MDYIRQWFGEVKCFPQISRLLQVFFPGAPVDVALGGDLQAEIACGNPPSPESHTGTIRAKIAQDLVNGLALMSKRLSISDIGSLRVSPLDTVEGKKLRIIHDLLLLLLLFLTFSVLVANPKKLLYTVANPARGLLNREKRTKEKVWQPTPPPPPPPTLLVRRK